MHKILTLCLMLVVSCAAQAQAPTPFVAAVQTLRPGAQFNLVGDTCPGLQWTDAVQTKPTCAEIATQMTANATAATAEQTRQSDIKGDAQRAAMLARLKTATSADIDAWLTTNVTTLAQARQVLGIILKMIALDARN